MHRFYCIFAFTQNIIQVMDELLCALFGARFSVRTATTKSSQYFCTISCRNTNQLSLATIKFEATLWSQIQIQLR